MYNFIFIFIKPLLSIYTILNNSNTSLTTNTTHNVREYVLNLGPQHPAAHGVLRLVLQLEGELIVGLDLNIGFLHRGSEKLMENQSLFLNTVYFDRLDYTSVLTQTHAYCLAVESVSKVPVENNITLTLRTVFDELARILNHLLSIATHTLDIGSMAPFFWAFEDRERIMELFEYVSGARMHANLYFPHQNLQYILTENFVLKILIFLRNCHKSFSEMFILLFNNRVWKLRLVELGIVSSKTARILGVSGPILRSTGIYHDLRLTPALNYGCYRNVFLMVYLGIHGDCYDRFLIRSRELFESTSVIYQIMSNFSYYNRMLNYNLAYLFTSNYNLYYKLRIESLINLFKSVNFNFVFNKNYVYSAVEAGKGEFGVSLITYKSHRPYRVFIRSPAFTHLLLINLLGAGCQLADIITIIGTLDIVFGEIDR